jgi:ribosomal protein L35
MVMKVAGRGHLLAHKSSKKKRQMKRQPMLRSSDAAKIKRMIQA